MTSPIDDPLALSDTKPWEMWGTTHGADDDIHDFLFIMKFSSWFLWQFSLFVIILHMYFLERKEYVLSGECIRSPPPCLDLLIARIGITFGRVLPLWSFSAWWWSWWSNDNHIIQSFCFTPLIILRMTMIMRTMFFEMIIAMMAVILQW